MIELDKATGPDCPRCGCNATTLATAGQRAGQPFARYACDHCGHAFTPSAKAVPTVEYNATSMRCPSCKSTQTSETGRRRGRVYGKCDNCGQKFYACEKV